MNNIQCHNKFPKYPFLWNYDDMYNIIDYTVEDYNNKVKDYNDNIIIGLNKIFPSHKIIKTTQKILRSEIKNINIHTWYLSFENIFTSNNTDVNIKIDSEIEYNKKVFAFIFDPNSIFEISRDKIVNNINNITIIKNINNINNFKSNNFMHHIHIHNVDGILRFSPNENSQIKIKNDVINNIFYTILNNIIVINEIFIL